jgi:peptidoglycan/xylan/chitin deacetylase (PgdA/CDA1 family)
MNKKYLYISALCFGFAFISCKQATKQTKNSNATNAVILQDSSTANQTANTAAQIYAKKEVPVLCYHRITDGSKGDYTVSPATFTAHIKVLADSGYHSISPTQLYDYLVYNKVLPEKPVIISFDDSRMEHFTIAAPVMKKYNFRGVFFIMTITYNKKNYMTTDQITQLSKAGHTIGLHSWDHTMVTKYKEAADWQKQVVEPRKKLEGFVGMSVNYWAYPNGVYNHKSAEEISQYFKLSFSLASKRDTLQPLQCIRRIIVPECTPQGLLKSMRRTFEK